MDGLLGCRDSRLFRAAIFAGGLLFVAITPRISADDAATSPARRLPSKGLYAYVEYNGLLAHSAAWKGTAAHDILAKSSAGAMVTDVMRRQLESLVKLAPDRKFRGHEIVAIEEHLVDHGFALAFYDEDGHGSTVFILKAAGKDATRKIELVRRYILMSDDSKPLPNSTALRGRAIFKFGDQQDSNAEDGKPANDSPSRDILALTQTDLPKLLSTWFEGNDLIVVLGPNPDLLSLCKFEHGS